MTIHFDAARLSGLTDIEMPIYGVKASDPYQITAIDGLDPPEFDVLLEDVHLPDGVFINRQALGREIVVRAGLNPDYRSGETVADLRQKLYGLLSPRVNPRDQSIVFSLVQAGTPVVETRGFVKKIEIVPFNKDPEVQITIPCTGPYLSEPQFTEVTDIPNQYEWTLENPGLAPTGIAFQVGFPDGATRFNLTLVDGAHMSFSSNFAAGEKLIVDTNPATRFVGHARLGSNNELQFIRYLDVLTDTSEWIMLHGGIHAFRNELAEAPNGSKNFTWDYFRYKNRYWGI